MPDFVQDGGYPIEASGGSGADADGAVDRGVRDGDPQSPRLAGADPEVRHAAVVGLPRSNWDVVAGGQICVGEEGGLARVQQSSPQVTIRHKNVSVWTPSTRPDHVPSIEWVESIADVQRQRDVIEERRFADGLCRIPNGEEGRIRIGGGTVAVNVHEVHDHGTLSPKRAAKGDRVPRLRAQMLASAPHH